MGGVSDEGRLVLDPGIGVAVAELRRAERVESFGVGRHLSRAECLYVLRHGLFIRRSREGWDDSQEPDGKSRQGELTTINIHSFPPFLWSRTMLHSRSFLSSTPFSHARPCNLKPQRRDLMHVLHRPVELAG